MLKLQFSLHHRQGYAAYETPAAKGGPGAPAIAVQPPLQNSLFITQSFGRRVRVLRLQGGLTREGLADRLGVDGSFVRDVELGDRALSLGYLKAVAIVFKVSLEELLTGV